MMYNKYIDTQTVSCYSLPCLLTLSLEVSSFNTDPVPRPHWLLPCSLPWTGFPNIPTFNLQTFQRGWILTPFLSHLLQTPTL